MAHHHLPPLLGVPGEPLRPRQPQDELFALRHDVQELYLNAGRLQLSLPEVPQVLNPHDSITVFHDHRPCKMHLADLVDMMFNAFFDQLRRHPDQLRILCELVSQRLNLSQYATKDAVAQAISDVYENLLDSVEDGILTEEGDFILAEDGDALEEEET